MADKDASELKCAECGSSFKLDLTALKDVNENSQSLPAKKCRSAYPAFTDPVFYDDTPSIFSMSYQQRVCIAALSTYVY